MLAPDLPCSSIHSSNVPAHLVGHGSELSVHHGHLPSSSHFDGTKGRISTAFPREGSNRTRVEIGADARRPFETDPMPSSSDDGHFGTPESPATTPDVVLHQTNGGGVVDVTGMRKKRYDETEPTV